MENKTVSKNVRLKFLAGASALAVFAAQPGAVMAKEMPSANKMWEIIQKQQAQIENLQKKSKARNVQVQNQVQARAQTTDGGETQVVDEDAAGLLDQNNGGGTGWWTRTSLGGYGELHINGGDTDEVDFHRYVLFVNHEFNDWIKFNSEFELEHSIAGEGKNGEIELEQAFLHFSINEDRFGAISKALNYVDLGISLIPIGIINETHEPPTFYGVERNDVEKRIIPATWWEAGAKAGGKLGETGLFWDAMVHSGLNNSVADGSTPGSIRGGRQKVSKATADNPAYTGRVGWAYKGIKLAGTYQHQTDITPNDVPKTEARLLEAHADIMQPLNDRVSLGLRALYARWDVGGDVAEASGRDKLHGWYVEPSVKFELPNWGAFGVFYRYETWDEKAGDATASVNSRQTYGFNYWPTENVVLKADWRRDNNDAGGRGEDNRFDFGLGFQF